jgi:hypothetical protein
MAGRVSFKPVGGVVSPLTGTSHACRLYGRRAATWLDTATTGMHSAHAKLQGMFNYAVLEVDPEWPRDKGGQPIRGLGSLLVVCLLYR